MELDNVCSIETANAQVEFILKPFFGKPITN